MSPRRKVQIGFVILTWNSEKCIDKCLRSVVELDAVSPCAVIVDNGSADRTPEIVRRYETKYPSNISMIQYRDNKGTTVSRNDGLKRLMSLRPDFYCVLDSDTEVNDEAFLQLVSKMNEHREYGIIGPSMVTSSGVLQASARRFPTAIEKICKAIPLRFFQERGEELEAIKPPTPDAASYPVDYLMSACWLIRPETLDKAGLLDEKIFYAPEDAEYCIRVWKAGYQVAFCPGARIIHEWQRLSRRKFVSRINWEHIKGLGYMFRKHRYLFTTDKLRKSFMEMEREST